MDYQKSIPLTGSGIVIGGIAISGYWIILLSLIIVSLAALLIRLFFRKGKTAFDL
jgi:uncharacterized membrane protein